jgi:uncharacterized protein YecT (DUF1311 family)
MKRIRNMHILLALMVLIGGLCSNETVAEETGETAQQLLVDIDQDGVKEEISVSLKKTDPEIEQFELVLARISRGQEELISFVADAAPEEWLHPGKVEYQRLPDAGIILIVNVYHDYRAATGSGGETYNFFLITPDMMVKKLLQMDGGYEHHNSVAGYYKNESKLQFNPGEDELFTMQYVGRDVNDSLEETGCESGLHKLVLYSIGLTYDAGTRQLIQKRHAEHAVDLCLQDDSDQASFDCSKAATTAEKQICADWYLRKMDGILSDQYHRQLKQVSAEQKQHLKTAQRQWLQERNRQACASSHFCLKQSYIRRINELSGKVPNDT